MIAVDWGTSTCRAYRLRAGSIVDRREAPLGIVHVAGSAFAATLHSLIDAWLADGEDRVLLGGMIGSRNGWVETAYVPCPISPGELADRLVPVPFDGAVVRLVPGVSAVDQSGVPEFMRGEECQILGTDVEGGTVCLPGTHSKWVRIVGGRIEGFSTYLTGDAYGALRAHTILSRSIVDSAIDLSAFDAGLARSAEPGGLLHHLFGVRALSLVDRLHTTAAGWYLSGLLIGHELRGLFTPGSEVHVIGSSALTELYSRAIAASGGHPRSWGADTAALGFHRIGSRAQWT